MKRPIMKDPIFLAQKSEPATAEDLGVAQDLPDTPSAIVLTYFGAGKC